MLHRVSASCPAAAASTASAQVETARTGSSRALLGGHPLAADVSLDSIEMVPNGPKRAGRRRRSPVRLVEVAGRAVPDRRSLPLGPR